MDIDINNIPNINDIDIDVEHAGKILKKDDILKLIDQSIEDEAIMDSIITNVEKSIYFAGKAKLVVSFPYIGLGRIRPALLYMKEWYKENNGKYGPDVYNVMKKQAQRKAFNKEKLEDINKRFINRRISLIKKRYENLCKEKGFLYAKLYVKFNSVYKAVEFDDEFESHYQSLSENSKD